jgi:hypothetical protein
MRLNRMLTVAATIVALMGLTIPAQAGHDKPPVEYTEFDVVLPGTGDPGVGRAGYCEFQVTVHAKSGQTADTKVRGNGVTVTRFKGPATATVTNDETGKTVEYDISGPGTQTTYPDGAFKLDLTGNNLLWTTVANSYPGVPQLAYTVGHVKVSVDAGPVDENGDPTPGLTTSYKLKGKSTDVCTVLS